MPKPEGFRCHLVSKGEGVDSYFFFLLSPSESKCSSLIVPVLSLLCSTQRDKFVEIDLKPVCKYCYEKMPEEFKRRLAKREREAKDKEKQRKRKPVCL